MRHHETNTPRRFKREDARDDRRRKRERDDRRKRERTAKYHVQGRTS